MKISICTALAVFIFLTSSHFSFSQSDSVTSKKRFYIGYLVSPDLQSTRYALGPGADPFQEQLLISLYDRKKSQWGYSLGINTLNQIHKNLILELSFLYSQKGELYETYTAPAFASSASTSTHNHLASYLIVPVKANFILSHKKISPFVSWGFSTNIFLNERIRWETSERIEIYQGNNEKYRPVNFQGIIGFGANMDFDRILVRFEPIFQHSLSRIYKKSTLKTYYYSVGLNIGMYYNLVK